MSDDTLRAALDNLPQWAMVGPMNNRHMEVVRPGQYWSIVDVRAALAASATDERLDVDRLGALVRDRWLATVEWDGQGSRAQWRCMVCGRYDRHADDACPIEFILAALASSAADERNRQAPLGLEAS